MTNREAVGYNEYFEWWADWFCRETGKLAPGKAESIETASEHSEKERREAWDKWLPTAHARVIKAVDTAASAQAAMEGQDGD